MKYTIITILAIAFIPLSHSYSQIPSYSLTARNLRYIANDSLTFDVYLKNTGSGDLWYAGGQYFMNYNPGFLNGGTPRGYIVQSGFGLCSPDSVSVTSGRISFSSMTMNMNDCGVSSSGLGTLVAKIAMTTTTTFLPLDSFHLAWRNYPPVPVTKIAVFDIIGIIIEITNPQFHYIELLSGINSEETSNADYFELEQNYPNPFNPITIINFELRYSDNIKLVVHDLLGREAAVLVEGKTLPGRYKIEFNGNSYPSGIYFYELRTSRQSAVKRMLLVK